jgi:hypothetical protein
MPVRQKDEVAEANINFAVEFLGNSTVVQFFLSFTRQRGTRSLFVEFTDSSAFSDLNHTEMKNMI